MQSLNKLTIEKTIFTVMLNILFYCNLYFAIFIVTAQIKC